MDWKRTEEKALLQVVLGRAVLPKYLPHHSLRMRWRALRHALALTRAFDRGGAHHAQQLLENMVGPALDLSRYSHDIRVLQARKEASRLQAWITLLVGDRLCFASSFAICGGLRCLGYSCSMNVGYEYIHQYTETPLHAYVVYEEEVINDSSEIRSSFVPIVTYGKDQAL
jgi:hypothetical protein